jgi:hypothetical protein
MFNWDGQIVAGVLSDMQAADNIISILSDRADNRAADQREAQVYNQYAQLVARYNRLADRHNWVLAENKRIDAVQAEALAEKDRRIAQLIAENARLAEDKEEFRSIGHKALKQLDKADDEIRRLKIKTGELPPIEPDPDDDLW